MGILDHDREACTFCLPEATTCDFSLDGEAQDIHLARQTIPTPPVELEHEALPPRLNTLLAWPVELAAGSYLLVLRASGEGQVRLGLDSDRFQGTLFNGESATDSRLGRFSLLPGERSYVVPFTLLRSGSHTLELTGDPVALHGLRLYPMPVQHAFPLKGGVKAVLTEGDLQLEIINDLAAIRFSLPERGQDRLLLRRRSGPGPALQLRGDCSVDEAGDAWVPAGPPIVIEIGLTFGEWELIKPENGRISRGENLRVVQICDPVEGPYLVQEQGWWRVRGAQPVTLPKDEAAYQAAYHAWTQEHELPTPKHFHRFSLRKREAPPPPIRPVAYDLVKVYTGESEARLQPFGFIDGAVRPGHGCQYTMAIRDVDGDSRSASCIVRVDRLTAYIFAPRLLFAQSIASATLNGRPWHYLDDNLLLLPQAVGTYDIQVVYGSRLVPSITRTAACIRETDDTGFLAELPAYVHKLPPGLRYHAAIRLPEGVSLRPGPGVDMVRRSAEGVVISYLPGRITYSTTATQVLT